jgi:Domain of unknown function (DUF4115)
MLGKGDEVRSVDRQRSALGRLGRIVREVADDRGTQSPGGAPVERHVRFLDEREVPAAVRDRPRPGRRSRRERWTAASARAAEDLTRARRDEPPPDGVDAVDAVDTVEPSPSALPAAPARIPPTTVATSPPSPARPARRAAPSRSATASSRRRRRRRLGRVVVAIMAMIAVAAGAVFLLDRHHSGSGSLKTVPPATNAPPATAAAAPPATPAPAVVAPVAFDGTTAKYTAPAESFTVVLDAVGPCWVEVRRGPTGAALYAGSLGAGTQKRFDANGALWIRVGFSPNLKVSLNGVAVTIPGDRGQPVNLSFG